MRQRGHTEGEIVGNGGEAPDVIVRSSCQALGASWLCLR